MAKINPGTEKLDIRYAQIVNSERRNHYAAFANNLPFAEVSGDTINVLAIEACGIDKKSGSLLSNPSLGKKGLNREELRERHRIFKENMSTLTQQINLTQEDKKQKAEKLEKKYFNESKRVPINFGFEKLLCIREYLTSIASKGIFLNRFEGESLERVRRYALHHL